MISEKTGDIWDVAYNDFWRVIPTNGSVNRSGLAVMGRGVALQAARRYLHLQLDLGRDLKKSGLRTLLYSDKGLVIFPVKFQWMQKASLTLIDKSACQLVELLGRAKIVMPRVGAGNGRLDWTSVKKYLYPRLEESKGEIIVLEYDSAESI